MKKLQNPILWIPLLIALAFIAGMMTDRTLCGYHGRSEIEKKFNAVLELIRNRYVDEVDIDSLLEATLPALVQNLDPHSVYLSAEELRVANEKLEGSFSGVGIEFTVNNDTITVIRAIPGGPAEKVGIQAGDRIVTVDGHKMAGISISTDSVYNTLRGDAGTAVHLGIKRPGARDVHTFEVIRGAIPMNSVDAAYMLDDNIGYVKVNTFARNTYNEFYQALSRLRRQGATEYVVDLRDNGGGLMDQAIAMANEFLPANAMIVYTVGRMSSFNEAVIADGSGSFTDSGVTVLLDEFSASASEIFAGAIQDNDRGIIIGRRSYGKGLVQSQEDLPDGSAIRLTVARYHTPSGRCIQKDYSDAAAYENDLIDRFMRGENMSADSIHLDMSLSYSTIGGRTVYGGGGIMPDIFVPTDTAGITSYTTAVANAGLLQRFALEYCDLNRADLQQYTSTEELLQVLPPDEMLLNAFVSFARANGVPARWYYINLSRDLLVNHLKALIARDMLGYESMYEILNTRDPMIQRAVEQIKQPTTK